jgi:hypothetical protein
MMVLLQLLSDDLKLLAFLVRELVWREELISRHAKKSQCNHRVIKCFITIAQQLHYLMPWTMSRGQLLYHFLN